MGVAQGAALGIVVIRDDGDPRAGSDSINVGLASIGSEPMRSYSAMTCAPSNKTIAPISTLSNTAIEVVSDP